MRVQSISLIVNDPLLLPCAASRFSDALELLSPGSARAVGLGYFELGEPLVTKLRPPSCGRLAQVLGTTYAKVVTALVHRDGEGSVNPYDLQPFRYRNWFFGMSGSLAAFQKEAGDRLAIPSYIASNIRGHTLAEVFFHQILAYLHRQGLVAGERYDMAPLRKALQSAISHDPDWFGEMGAADNSILLSDGSIVVGAALDRPVYVREIAGLDSCLACGMDVDGNPVAHEHLRGLVIMDADGLPSQEWKTVGPRRIFQVDTKLAFDHFPL